MLKKIEDIHILVIGDIMLDRYLSGPINRLSPEAPVPIVEIKDQKVYLGGCGNAARNISALGAKCTCMSVTGDDSASRYLLKNLEEDNLKFHIIKNPNYRTIEKYRIFENERNVQVLRYDIEEISPQQLDIDIEYINNNFDIILVSDYAKGVVTHALMNELRKCNKPIIIDPKIRPDMKGLYDEVFLVKANEKEYKMLPEINCKYILKTVGAKGMVLYDSEKNEFVIKGKPVEVYNVCGAGDTVAAILSVCIAMGLPVLQASQIACRCAEYVVTKSGTATIDPMIFAKSLMNTNR